MKTWKLCLAILVLTACSRTQQNKNATPTIFINLVKKYPELYPYGGVDGYHFVREVRSNDSLKMQLYQRDNSGDLIVVFINKFRKSYAFPMPENRDSNYWRFDNEIKAKARDGKTFESEFRRAFKALSLDDGWIADAIFHDFASSLLQTRIVFPSDSLRSSVNNKRIKSCDTTADRRLKSMYQDVLVVPGLTANTF